MATQKADVGNDFATVIGRAMEPPATPDLLGKDLPDGFPFSPPPTHRVVDTTKDPEGIPGAVAYDFHIQRRVFLIYRPWESCGRCQNAVASSQVTLPDEGDYECPHVNVAAYREICNQILAGKMLFGSEQEVVQKDGAIAISLRWYEKTLRPGKKGRRSSDLSGQQQEPDV